MLPPPFLSSDHLPRNRAITSPEISGATFGASPSELSGATFRPPPKPLARSPQEPLKISLNLSVCAIACSEISGATLGASPSEFSGATFRPPPKPLARSPQEPLKISLNPSVCPHRLRSCRLESLTCARAAPGPAPLSSCNSAEGPPQQGQRRQGQGQRGRGQRPAGLHGQGRRVRGQGRATLNVSSPRSTWISIRVRPLKALFRLGVTSHTLPPLLDMSTMSALSTGCIDVAFIQPMLLSWAPLARPCRCHG